MKLEVGVIFNGLYERSAALTQELTRAFKPSGIDVKTHVLTPDSTAELPSIDLLICDGPPLSIPTKKTVQRKKPGNWVLLCVSQPLPKLPVLPAPFLGVVPFSADVALWLKTVVPKIQTYVDALKLESGEGGNTNVILKDEDCVAFKTDRLMELRPLPVDVYIRLGSEKFVRLFSAGDQLDPNDQKRLNALKKTENLFIRKVDGAAVIAAIQAKAAAARAASPAGALGSGSKLAFDAVSSLAGQMGATAEVQKMVRSEVTAIVGDLKKRPALSQILSEFLKNKDNYLPSHSVFLSFLSNSLAATLQWESELTYYKLTMASFMHDITLKNNELALIQTQEEFDKVSSKFTPEEKKQFRIHGAQSAEFLQQFDDMPTEIDQIVLAHHERPDGSGFPRGLMAKQISPLASLFIFSHDMMTELFKQGPAFQMPKFLESREKVYASSAFRQIFLAVSKANKAPPQAAGAPAPAMAAAAAPAAPPAKGAAAGSASAGASKVKS